MSCWQTFYNTVSRDWLRYFSHVWLQAERQRPGRWTKSSKYFVVPCWTFIILQGSGSHRGVIGESCAQWLSGMYCWLIPVCVLQATTASGSVHTHHLSLQWDTVDCDYSCMLSDWGLSQHEIFRSNIFEIWSLIDFFKIKMSRHRYVLYDIQMYVNAIARYVLEIVSVFTRILLFYPTFRETTMFLI